MLRASWLILVFYSFLFLTDAEALEQDDVLKAIQTIASEARDIIEEGLDNLAEDNKDAGGDIEKECLEAKSEFYSRLGVLKIDKIEIGLTFKYTMKWAEIRNMTISEVNEKINEAFKPITGQWYKEKQNEVLDCLKDSGEVNLDNL